MIAAERLELTDADLDGGERIDLDAAQKLPLRDLLAKRRAGKLGIDDDALSALALEQARTSDQDWSRLAPDIPPTLQSAVLEKARHAASAAERANLLAWLERCDVPRTTLIPIALAAVGEDAQGFGLVAWLARQLIVPTAWAAHGAATFDAFIERQAFADLAELVTLTLSEAQRRTGEPPPGLLAAVHVAFAQVLVRRAADGVRRRVGPRALASLSALACLDLPPPLQGALAELRGLDGATQEVIDLVFVNETRAASGHPRDASLESLIAALHALADAHSAKG